MTNNITPARGASKAAPVIAEFPQKPTSFFRQVAALMRRRRVAAVFPPGADSADPAETLFILRGDVVAELEITDGDFHDRHFGTVHAVDAAVHA